MTKTEYPRIGETLYTAEADNGLKIAVIPKKGFSGFFAIFGTNYGGAHRNFELNGEYFETPAGVAHFLEHKMFDLPNGEDALYMMSRYGADPNAFTSSGATCYHFQCTNHFEENFRLLLHFVSTPYFTEQSIAKEQGIIGQEIRMTEDRPGNAIYYALLRLLYKNHPIRDEIVGTVDSIAQITPEILYRCHKAFYAPSNMVLVVEGDVNPEDICRIADEELGHDRAPVPCADMGESEELIPAGTFFSREMEVAAPQFLSGIKLPVPGTGEAELLRRHIASLAMKLLMGRSSRFYTDMYERGLLSRDFGYDIDYTAGTATLMFGGESSDYKAVIDAFWSAVDSALNGGFDKASLERAKRARIGTKLRGLEDFDNVCTSLAFDMLDGFNELDSTEILEKIALDDCVSFIRENLLPERLATAVILPIKK